MLVVTRKNNESLIISEDIEITILEISKDRVKIGIQAPKEVKIVRRELIDTQNANRESSEAIAKSALDALLKNLPKL